MKLNVLDPIHSRKEMKKTPMLVGTPKTCYYGEGTIEAQADLPTFESVVGNKERSS
jgi:hypothetical protein